MIWAVFVFVATIGVLALIYKLKTERVGDQHQPNEHQLGLSDKPRYHSVVDDTQLSENQIDAMESSHYVI